MTEERVGERGKEGREECEEVKDERGGKVDREGSAHGGKVKRRGEN